MSPKRGNGEVVFSGALGGQPVTPAAGAKGDSARLTDTALTRYVCVVLPVFVSSQETARRTTGTPRACACVIPALKVSVLVAVLTDETVTVSWFVPVSTSRVCPAW